MSQASLQMRGANFAIVWRIQREKMMPRPGYLWLLSALLLLESCGSGGSRAVSLPPSAGGAVSSATMPTATSISPANVTAPPMAITAVQPGSAMSSLRHTTSDITPVGFTQIPGAAVNVAASPDGSIWVLSTQGGPVDKAIYKYQNGTWTNIPGAAMRLAVGPDNALWAVNSAGGIYRYFNNAWTTIAGGASDISIGPDGSVYVISNQNGGPFGNGIYKYLNGTWTQLPGAGVRVAASWDTRSCYKYNVAAGSIFVVNAQNSLYSYSPQAGYTSIPGAGIQVAPTMSGGLFVLGVPGSPNGNPIYYYNLVNGASTQQVGAGVSVATSGANGAVGASVYVIGAGGGIYQAPLTTLGVNLNCAATFAILAGSTVTNTGPTSVTGDLGLFPGTAVTGFPPGAVTGAIHAGDAIAQQAELDLTSGYNDAVAFAGAPITVSGNLGGLTLAPGLYKSTSSLAISSGDLTLDAGGNANAVFVFQMASTLTTTPGRAVILAGGAKAGNIYWQVGSSATLGTTSKFYGNLLVSQSITMQTGATLTGRALTQIGAVALDSNTLVVP